MKDFTLPTYDFLDIDNFKEKDVIKPGFFNEKIIGSESLIHTIYAGKMKNTRIYYSLNLYPFLLSKNEELKETFVLIIDPGSSWNRYIKSLPVAGFGSYSHIQFGSACDNIARKFCEANNLIINTEVNHWPKLQYVVSVNKNVSSDVHEFIAETVFNASVSAVSNNFRNI